MFESRASLPNEVKADIESFLSSARNTNCAWAEARILPVAVRRNIKLAEAPSYGKTIFEYEPSCHGAEDYRKVAEFIHDPNRAVAADTAVAENPTTIQSAAVSHEEPANISPIPIVDVKEPALPDSRGAVTEISDSPQDLASPPGAS
jgi:chromosome partitioning protein